MSGISSTWTCLPAADPLKSGGSNVATLTEPSRWQRRPASPCEVEAFSENEFCGRSDSSMLPKAFAPEADFEGTTGISIHIPQFIVGCNYSTNGLDSLPASGTKLVMYMSGRLYRKWLRQIKWGRCVVIWPNECLLIHWGREKMDAISQTMLSNTFSWMKMSWFRLKFHWGLFLRVQLMTSQHWFRYWLGADQATSHCLNQWWLDYRRIYASLDLNQLTHFEQQIRVWYRGKFSPGLCELEPDTSYSHYRKGRVDILI